MGTAADQRTDEPRQFGQKARGDEDFFGCTVGPTLHVLMDGNHARVQNEFIPIQRPQFFRHPAPQNGQFIHHRPQRGVQQRRALRGNQTNEGSFPVGGENRVASQDRLYGLRQTFENFPLFIQDKMILKRLSQDGQAGDIAALSLFVLEYPESMGFGHQVGPVIGMAVVVDFFDSIAQLHAGMRPRIKPFVRGGSPVNRGLNHCHMQGGLFGPLGETLAIGPNLPTADEGLPQRKKEMIAGIWPVVAERLFFLVLPQARQYVQDGCSAAGRQAHRSV